MTQKDPRRELDEIREALVAARVELEQDASAEPDTTVSQARLAEINVVVRRALLARLGPGPVRDELVAVEPAGSSGPKDLSVGPSSRSRAAPLARDLAISLRLVEASLDSAGQDEAG